MIILTESAISKIEEIISEQNNPKIKLRMYVEGGGCSGFSYGFAMEEDQQDDDWEISAASASVLIDPISAQYLEGITVDYKDDLNGARFAISNPQAATTCGCGSSFSPY